MMDGEGATAAEQPPILFDDGPPGCACCGAVLVWLLLIVGLLRLPRLWRKGRP